MCSKLCQFYQSTIGKKIIVALTGLVMVLWLIGHMAGNLQVFAGQGPSVDETLINQYAAMLHSNMILLWGVRFTMLFMVTLHITNTIQLTLRNKAARPQSYAMKKSVEATLASRTMIFGGITLLLYIIYHLMHLTFGTVHPDLFIKGDVYGNMVKSFQVPMISGAYLLGQAALFMHLIHGIQSVARTLGISHEKLLGTIKSLGIFLACAITLGFSSIPIAVLFGCLR